MSDTASDQEKADQFERELCWCIEQLELGLTTRKPDSKQAREATKILKVLKNPKALLVKKRQVMRTTFGDYRKKILAEEKQFIAKASKMSLAAADSASLSQAAFYRMCESKMPEKGMCGESCVKSTGQTAQHSNGKTDSATSCDDKQTAFIAACVYKETDTKANSNETLDCLTSLENQVLPVGQEQDSKTKSDNALDTVSVIDQSKKQCKEKSEKSFKYEKSDNSFRFAFSKS